MESKLAVLRAGRANQDSDVKSHRKTAVPVSWGSQAWKCLEVTGRGTGLVPGDGTGSSLPLPGCVVERLGAQLWPPWCQNSYRQVFQTMTPGREKAQASWAKVILIEQNLSKSISGSGPQALCNIKILSTATAAEIPFMPVHNDKNKVTPQTLRTLDKFETAEMANLIFLIVWLCRLPVSSAKKRKENAELPHESRRLGSLFVGGKMMSFVLPDDCCKTGRGFPWACLSALCVIWSEGKEMHLFRGVGLYYL